MLSRFPEGSRVAFIGDSITAENLALQHIIGAYKRQGISNIRFFNCGVAGGTAEFAVTSYEDDVKRYKPTHALVSFGINDSRRELLLDEKSPERLSALIKAFEVYKVKMAELIDLLLADGVDVTLCTPVPYDEYYSESTEQPLHGGYALMLGYSEYVRRLASEKKVHLYDQHRVISELLASDKIHFPDRIHPNAYGYYMLAREFLKEQGIDLSDCELSDSFSRWHPCVARLRKVLAAECMLVPMMGLSYDSPTHEKVAAAKKRVDNGDFIKPVFESFFRAYVADKPLEEELYRIVDEYYENDVI